MNQLDGLCNASSAGLYNTGVNGDGGENNSPSIIGSKGKGAALMCTDSRLSLKQQRFSFS